MARRIEKQTVAERIAVPIRAAADRFALLLLFLVALAIMGLTRADSPVADRIRSGLTDMVSPVLQLVSQPMSTVEGWWRQGQEMTRVYQQNRVLEAEVQRLKGWEILARKAQEENAALRRLLNLQPDPKLVFTSARVIADTSGPFVRTLIVNAGSNAGVRKGQAVIDGVGLLGRIDQAGLAASRVILITDLNSRIPVVIEGARHRAILTGDNGDHPQLKFLSPDAKVKTGDRVVTSGAGGLFPPGLPIGLIVADGVGGTGSNAAPVHVQPFVDFARPDYVRVVRFAAPVDLSTAGEDRKSLPQLQNRSPDAQAVVNMNGKATNGAAALPGDTAIDPAAPPVETVPRPHMPQSGRSAQGGAQR